MAIGDTTDTSVISTPGEATGRSAQGAQGAVIPGDIVTVRFAAGPPSGAPNGSPLYINTSNSKLYVYNATSATWLVPSGANT